jgi:hypothetical protein
LRPFVSPRGESGQTLQLCGRWQTGLLLRIFSIYYTIALSVHKSVFVCFEELFRTMTEQKTPSTINIAMLGNVSAGKYAQWKESIAS